MSEVSSKKAFSYPPYRLTPDNISLFFPEPGTLVILNPASIKPRRTMPAEVKVLIVVPDLLSSAMVLNNLLCHISGFFAGAKPSRYQQSIFS